MNLILKNYLIIRRKKSCYIQIISIDRPEVTSILSSPYIVEEGQTVSLSCAVIDANPNTNITWRWFRTDRPYNTLFYGPNYTVSNIQRNMSGSYTCTARNSVGTSEADVINVDVQCGLSLDIIALML